MQHPLFALAGLLGVLLTLSRAAAGLNRIFESVFAIDMLPMAMKWQLFIGWHVGIVALFVASVTYIACAFDKLDKSAAILATALFASWGVFAVSIAVWTGTTWTTMTPYGFALIGLIGLIGVMTYSNKPTATIHMGKEDAGDI